MNKKTIEQIELMLRREVMRLEKSFTEDLVRNSSTMRVLSERVRAMEEKDVVKSISIILAKCDFVIIIKIATYVPKTCLVVNVFMIF